MMLSDILPAAINWHPEQDDLVLLAAVESDLPVVEAVLAQLPKRARGQVFIEVADESRIVPLSAPGRVCVSWLTQSRGQSLGTAVPVWLSEMLPVEADREHHVYAWSSGDTGAQLLTSW